MKARTAQASAARPIPAAALWPTRLLAARPRPRHRRMEYGRYDQHGSRLSVLPRPLIAGRYVCLWRLRRRYATVKRRCPKAKIRELNQLTARQVS